MTRTMWRAAGLIGTAACFNLIAACSKTDSASKADAPAAAEAVAANSATAASGSLAGRASADASATAAVNASAKLPQIGGAIAALGDFNVEVALHENGRIEAQVTDRVGKLVQSGVELAVTAKAHAAPDARVNLAFSPPEARFVGQAGAGVELESGPVNLELKTGGQTLNGKLALVAALPEATLGGHMLAVGNYSAEVLLDAAGEVRARLVDATGALVKAGADVSVDFATSLERAEHLALAFDADAQCFSGKLAGSARIQPGPLTLRLKLGGVESVGALLQAGVSARASHGGAMLALGSYGVELVAEGPKLKAFVFDGLARPSLDAGLKLQVAAGAKANSNIDMNWDASCRCYVSVGAPKLDLSLVPLRVSLNAAGKAFHGALASVRGAAKAAAAAKLVADADVSAQAKLGAGAKLEANAPNLDVKGKLDSAAASAAKAAADARAGAKAAAGVKVTAPKIEITPPKLNVNVGASAGTKAKATSGAKASTGFSIGH